MKKYAVMMNMPEGKLPGFYAQIVKALANKVALFDRDKEILIVNTEAECELVIEVMDKYHIEYEPLVLLLLPDHALAAALQADDYGFTSRSEHTFLYEHLIGIFRFQDNQSPASEKSQALLQMEEHLIARYTEEGVDLYAVEKQLEPLIHGIAKAYKCEVEFVVYD